MVDHQLIFIYLPKGVIRGQERLYTVTIENISNIQAYCTPNGNSQRINLLALADSAFDLKQKGR